MNNVKWGVILILFYCVFFQPVVFGQEVQYDYLKEPVVLPGIQVNCILKDSRGFIWFGTEQGLVKYDGYDYKIFNEVTGKKNSLSSSKINSLIEDGDQKLWIGTFQGGLNWFDPVTETFHNYYTGKNDSIKFGGSDINDMALQSDGTLWIGYRNGGLDRFDPGTERIINYQNQNGKIGNIINIGVSALYFDSKENLWIGTWDNGLALLKNKEITSGWNKNIVFEDHSGSWNGTRINKIFSIKEDQDGHIWLSSFGEGIFRYDPVSKLYNKLNIPEKSIPGSNLNSRDMIISSGGNLICGNDAAVLVNTVAVNRYKNYSDNTEQIVPVPTDYTSYSLASGSKKPVIYSLMMTNDEILWVGTDIGVYKFIRKRFETFYVAGNLHNADNITATTKTTDGKLYLSLWNKGLYYTTITNNDIRDARFRKVTIPGVNLSEITALAPGKNGEIWYAKIHQGIFKYNPRTNSITTFQNNTVPEILGDINYCITAVEGPGNSIWFGTAAGLLIYYYDLDSFFFSSYQQDDPATLSNEFVTSIEFDGDSVAWVGTLQGGLNKGRIHHDEQGRITFENYTYNSMDPNSISENHISCMHLSGDGKLWIGTGNNGLNIYDRKNNNFRRITRKDGLGSSKINAILEDNNEKIWIGTFAGLSKISPQDFSVINYSVSFERQIVYFNMNSAFTLNDLLVFGTREDFICFDPDKITTHLPADQVRFTNFVINNHSITPGEVFNKEKILTQSLDYTSHISLSYYNNTFSVQFSLLDYHEPSKNRYYYKLEDFDKEWRQAPALYRQADYTNLLPGDYVFRVKAENSDGFETCVERSLLITILPPWYKTQIAIIIYLLSLAALAIIIRQITISRLNYINEINTRKLIHEKDNEINKAKLKFFTNISHEIRTPVTLILAPLESLYNSTSDDNLKKQVGIVLRNARKLHGLLSQLMDFRKIETGNVRLKVYQYEISDFMDDIIEDFRGPCAQKNITLEFKSAFESSYAWFDREKMDKVLRNLLSNALKFTPESGRIEVKTYISKENIHDKEKQPGAAFWVIKVKDTGRGIPPEHLSHVFDRFYQVEGHHDKHNPLGTGIGLSIVKEYVTLHNGHTNAESIPGIETIFSVSIPIEKENYNENILLEAPVISISEMNSEWNEIIDNKDTGDPENNNLIKNDEITILIAEDNTELRKFIKESLQNSFNIIEAENGRMAYDMAFKLLPDLIISDVMMPEMDGLELTQKIKTNIKTSHIPVILLTAKSAIEDRIAGLKTGADSYIPKPFHPEHLEVRIRKLTELRRILKKKFSQDISIDIESMEIGSLDAEFLRKLNDIINKNIGDFELSVEKLCKHVGMSRSNLFKKLKSLTDLTPTEYMRNIRLNKALHVLLEDRSLNIADVGYSVGFSSPAYFTACFRKIYGLPPREFIEDYLKKKEKPGEENP